MADQPINLKYFACYPAAWLNPNDAGQLSLEALGAWFKINCLMWRDGTGSGTISGTTKSLSRLLGANSINQMQEIIDEMIETRVGHIEVSDKRYTFDSPRMRKEWKIALAKAQKKSKADKKYYQNKTSNKDSTSNSIIGTNTDSDRNESGTSISISQSLSNTSVVKDKSASKFKPPEPHDTEEYFTEKGSTKTEATQFRNFYESKGWMVGKNKMKSWRASASGWINRNKKENERPLTARQSGQLSVEETFRKNNWTAPPGPHDGAGDTGLIIEGLYDSKRTRRKITD